MLPIPQVMIVPFRSRRSNLSIRPVQRIKHVVDKQGGVVAAILDVTNLIIAKDAPTIGNTPDVVTGSKVNGIYLNVEAYATTASALANIYMIIMKNPGNNLTIPTPNLVGGNDNKRFVIHQEMKMLEQSVNGNPRTIFNGVVVIPRGYRRFGPSDRLVLAVLAPGVNISLCIQCHYKEFR